VSHLDTRDRGPWGLSETGGSLELVIDESEFAFGYLRFVGPHDGIPETKQTGKHAMKLGATEFSDNATYDYVIVGAGTAGCVLAARLSESPSAGVLPLEAGSSEPLDAMAVPAAWPTLLSTSADWADKTQSYDEWAVAGSGFDELLPFFRRSERTVGRDENLRGTNGPLAAGPAATTHPFHSRRIGGRRRAGLRPSARHREHRSAIRAG
jgi:choline dehydrogenase-like flavoprotein